MRCHRFFLLGLALALVQAAPLAAGAPEPLTAIHVSEATRAQWPKLPAPHTDWKYWHIYGFLMEALKSDGTPYVQVSDQDIAAGKLLDGQRPRYPIVISLATACIADRTAAQIKQYVEAGGHAYVGATAWTRDEAGTLRGSADQPQFALADQLGVVPGKPVLISTARKLRDDPLVSHLKEEGVRNWLLPRASNSIGYAHPQHWAQAVTAKDARVLLASGDHPLMTIKDCGAGRFIYHAEFAPLAGYSGYVVDNYEYGFFRTAIEQAFAANRVPLVRLAPWPYPYHAAFKTRHDHFLHKEASDLEAKHGLKGEWLLRTNEAVLAGDWKHLKAIVANGALVGSHTLNEYCLDTGGYQAAYDNVHQSLEVLAKHLGSRPRVFVAPGMFAFRDTSLKALVDNGVVTTGDMSHGPFPNFALKIHTVADYGPHAHWPLLEIPVSRYCAKPEETWGNLIFSHMESMDDATIEKTVDLTYDLGGIINIYDHIGDPTAALRRQDRPHPTTKHFEHYLKYGLAKPHLWKTDPLEVLAWWQKRDGLVLETTLVPQAVDRVEVRIAVAGPRDAGPFALDVTAPPGLVLKSVQADDDPKPPHRVEGRLVKVKVAGPGQVRLVFGP